MLHTFNLKVGYIILCSMLNIIVISMYFKIILLAVNKKIANLFLMEIIAVHGILIIF